MIFEVTNRVFDILQHRSSEFPLDQSVLHLSKQLFGPTCFFLEPMTALLKPRNPIFLGWTHPTCRFFQIPSRMPEIQDGLFGPTFQPRPLIVSPVSHADPLG